MNTATEAKLESDSERSVTDHRRGMKLVCSTTKPAKEKPISITISNEIFSLPVPGRKLVSDGLRDAAERSSKRTSGSARNIENEDESSLKLVAVTTGIAVLGAIVIGYLLGRSRH